METVVSSKGQIVIPVELRRKYSLKKGTRVHLTEQNGSIVLQPVNRAMIRSLRGMFRGGDLLGNLEADRARERDREDALRPRRAR